MAKTYTFKEFQREFFPNLLLERLEEKICSVLGINRDQSILSKDKKNPKTGSLKFIKPNYCLEKISDIIDITTKFYIEEGYKVEQKDNILNVKRGRENYCIMGFDHEWDYTLWVDKTHSSLYELGRKIAIESLEEANKTIENERELRRREKGRIIGLSCNKDLSNCVSSYSLRKTA